MLVAVVLELELELLKLPVDDGIAGEVCALLPANSVPSTKSLR